MRFHPMQTVLLAAAACAFTAVNPALPRLEAQTSGTSAQVKDDLFAGTEVFAKGATKVTEVDMDHNALADMNGSSATANQAHKMDLTVVHEYRYDKPGMYRIEDVESFRKKLQDGSWHCQVHTSEHTKAGDKSTDICYRPGPDRESVEQVVIQVEPLKLTFIHNRGRNSMTSVGRFDWGSPADRLDMMQMQIELSMLGTELGGMPVFGGGWNMFGPAFDFKTDPRVLKLQPRRVPRVPATPAPPLPPVTLSPEPIQP